jgi:RHS repeat-associated protein
MINANWWLTREMRTIHGVGGVTTPPVTLPGPGTDNFVLQIPVLSPPGRGPRVSLTLTYNSRVWTKIDDQTIVYDHGHGWPAPGWSFGFGRIVRFQSYGVALEDPDGTLHPFAGTVNTYASGFTGFVSQTTDGTFINSSVSYLNGGGGQTGTARFPDGTTVEYGAAEGATRDALYPTRITDPNGNYLTITYVSNAGPQIDTITDALGRTIRFFYDSNNLLTAIIAPGLGGYPRVAVRLTYTQLPITSAFASQVTAIAPPSSLAISSIYFPGTGTGYWFGDPNSYSAYGMITEVSQRRAMTFSGDPLSNLNAQGTVTAGRITRDQKYDYPTAPDPTLTDPPTYRSMTEFWDSMDDAAAVTSFSASSSSGARQYDVIYPNAVHVTQLRYDHPGQYDDGLLYKETTADASGNVVRNDATTWEAGATGAPRVKSVTTTDELGQRSTTTYGYTGPTDALADITEYDYDGTVARKMHTDFVTDSHYLQSNVYNLPLKTTVYGSDGMPVAVTQFSYDQDKSGLEDTPSVVGHSDVYNPYAPQYWVPPFDYLECDAGNLAPIKSETTGTKCHTVHEDGYWQTDYDSSTDYRGNLTSVTQFSEPLSPSRPITQTLSYDIVGNAVHIRPACCSDAHVRYSLATQYGFPDWVEVGPPGQPALIYRSSPSEFFTGLTMSSNDWTAWGEAGLKTAFSYDPSSLRLIRYTLPTGASVAVAYNDAELTTTTTVSDDQGQMSRSTVAHLNGRGQIRQTESLAPDGSWNVVANQYDNRAKLKAVSNPFTKGSQAYWTTYGYDALGRLIAISNPDGSGRSIHYDESVRPPSASRSPGTTVRAVDEVSRERWLRYDVLGRLAEVVEPDAYGDGRVSSGGTTETTYLYNPMGQLTTAVQGPNVQSRIFAYDGLGRMIAESVPEELKTLNDSGTFVGVDGCPSQCWSEVYTYDVRSNLISYTDARGVTTKYDYAQDSLNRLGSVEYRLDGFGDKDHPVAPAPNVYYTYMTSGDLRRISKITTAPLDSPPVTVTQYLYDDQSRLAGTVSSVVDASGTSQSSPVDYKFDSLSRVTQIVYPPVYHGPVAKFSREVVSLSYGLGGNPSELQVDGTPYASSPTYDAAGHVTSVIVGKSTKSETLETFQYDPKTELLAEQKVWLGAQPVVLDYSYFPGGQLRGVIDTPDDRKNVFYDYDALGRLWHAAGGPPKPQPPATIWNETYQYDAYGNKTSVAITGGALDGSPIPADGASTLTYDDGTNRITTAGYEYDAAGNATQAQRTDGSRVQYVYDAAGRMVQIQNVDGTVLERFTYGFDRRRLMVAAPFTGTGEWDTYIAWDGSRPILEYAPPKGFIAPGDAPPNSFRAHFYFGGRLLLDTYGTNVGGRVGQVVGNVYYHPDRVGTRFLSSESNGRVGFGEQIVLPYGTVMPGATSNLTNPIFTNYERSLTTGLDYAVNRYYDARTRFTQPEPLEILAADRTRPQSLNGYLYVTDDPLNGTDPSGLVAGDLGTWVGVGLAGLAIALGAFTLPVTGPVMAGVALTVAFGGGVAAGVGVAGTVINIQEMVQQRTTVQQQTSTVDVTAPPVVQTIMTPTMDSFAACQSGGLCQVTPMWGLDLTDAPGGAYINRIGGGAPEKQN